MAAGDAFASVDDMIALWRSMTTSESERAAALLPLVSDALRQQAANRGRDLDDMLERGITLPSVAKAVTVGIVSRILRENTMGEPVTQQSVTAGPYTQQSTYAVPGGGIVNAIMNNDLKALGLLRPRIGAIDPLRGRKGNTG